MTFYGEGSPPEVGVGFVTAMSDGFGGSINGRVEMQNSWLQVACSVRALVLRAAVYICIFLFFRGASQQVLFAL